MGENEKNYRTMKPVTTRKAYLPGVTYKTHAMKILKIVMKRLKIPKGYSEFANYRQYNDIKKKYKQWATKHYTEY